jgi:hypothetical protein
MGISIFLFTTFSIAFFFVIIKNLPDYWNSEFLTVYYYPFFPIMISLLLFLLYSVVISSMSLSRQSSRVDSPLPLVCEFDKKGIYANEEKY